MIKGAVGLLVFAGVVLAVTYYAGGIASHDPTGHGREVKAQLHEGMSWEEVVDIAGKARRFRMIDRVVEKDPNGNEYEYTEPCCSRDFVRVDVERMMADGELPDGFLLDYVYSAQVAFVAWFDGDGKLTTMENLATMADLLQTREP